MAKLYTAAEWNRLMNSLPPEDREPYSASPDVPEYTVRPTTAAPTTARPKTDAEKDAELGISRGPTPTTTERVMTTGRGPTTTVAPADGSATPRPSTTTTVAPADGSVTPRPVATTTQAPQNFSGDGTAARPLFLNGQKFTGDRNGIKYENGLFVNATRADVLEANREAALAAEAEARAAKDPKFDIKNRPQGSVDNNFIKYWSWVGTATDGEWKEYSAALTEENILKYGRRVFGGTTQAKYGSTTGQTSLNVEPTLVRDPYGNIIGYQIGDTQVTITGIAGGVSTTPRPGGTTVAPGGTTVAPGGTTVAPGGTTAKPGSTTLAPGATTLAPGATTMAPGATTATPKVVVSTYTDPVTGDIYSVFSDNSRLLLSKGTKTEEQATERRSAFQLLRDEFTRYGLQDLVGDVEKLVISGMSPQEFAIELRKTPVYERRFAANKARISKGLQAISEAEYIGLEDQYQDIMRRYGLPESYYKPGLYGVQENFEKLIANDVSNIELEDRIQTAQNRIQFANPEVGIALKTFYPDITNGDLLAYALDPEKALSQIKRRITAAEIGASAVQLGLATNVTDAEYLARYGVTKEQAQTGFRNVAEVLPRASQLGDIYAKQGMGPYTQTTATQEFFNVPGAAEAAAKRRKLAELETAQFSGQVGVGALARERAGQF